MLRMDLEDLEDSKLKKRLISDSKNLYEGLERIAKIVDSMRELSQQTNETKGGNKYLCNYSNRFSSCSQPL